MKRLVKILLITFAVLLVALVVGVWLLNRWLKSPEMRAHVEKELTAQLRMPLRFQSITLSLWSGLEARGITVPDRKGNFFEAAAFTADYKLWPLFRGQLAFGEVAIESPKFFLVQYDDGSWKGPEIPADLKAQLEAKKKAKADQPKEPKPATPKPKKRPDVLVESLVLQNGSATLIDKDGKLFALASGVNVKLLGKENRADGRVAIERLVWYDNDVEPGAKPKGFAGAQLKAGVTVEEKGISIPDLKLAIGGGTLGGTYYSRVEKANMRINIELAIDSVDLTRAARDADAQPPELTGTLTAKIKLRGLDSLRKTYTGNATVSLRDGTFQEMELYRDLASGLRIKEIENFGLRESRAELQLAYDKLTIKPFTISAPPLSLSAEGTGNLNGGKLALNAKLGIAPAFLKKQVDKVQAQFSAPTTEELPTLPFVIAGTFTKPKTNLRDRLYGTTDKDEQRAILFESAINAVIEDKENATPAPKK